MKQMYDDYYKRYPNGRCGCNFEREMAPSPVAETDTSCCDRANEKTGYAQAYVPYQEAGRLFSGEDSLSKGTVFPELNMPYVKGKNIKFFGGEALV